MLEDKLIKRVNYLRKQYERGKNSKESQDFYNGLLYAVKEMENFISENIQIEFMGTNYKYEASRWIQLMGEGNFKQELNEQTFEMLKDQLRFHCKGINENMAHCNRYDMFWKQIEIAALELTYNEFIQILIDNQYNRK